MDDDLAPTWRHVIDKPCCPLYLQTIEMQYIPRNIDIVNMLRIEYNNSKTRHNKIQCVFRGYTMGS